MKNKIKNKLNKLRRLGQKDSGINLLGICPDCKEKGKIICVHQTGEVFCKTCGLVLL